MANAKGGSRKLLWLMVILVVLCGSAAAVAVTLLLTRDAGTAQAAAQVETTPERRTPIFVTIDPFTVNLVDDVYEARLLYAGLSLKVGDQQTVDILTEHMPQVRSRLLMLFSGQAADELTGPGGKRALADKVLATLHDPMTEYQPELVIEDVLFTDFIVQ